MRNLRHLVLAGDILEDHPRLTETFLHCCAHLGQLARIAARQRFRKSKDAVGNRFDGIRAALGNRSLRLLRRRADRRQHEVLDADLGTVEVQRINSLVEQVLHLHVLLGHGLDHHRVALIGLILKLADLIRRKPLRLFRSLCVYGVRLGALGFLRRLLARRGNIDGVSLAHVLFSNSLFFLHRSLRRLLAGGCDCRIRHLRIGGNIVDSHFAFLLDKIKTNTPFPPKPSYHKLAKHAIRSKKKAPFLKEEGALLLPYEIRIR